MVAMTDSEYDKRLGAIVREQAERRRAVRPLLDQAKRIGRRLEELANALQVTPFGIIESDDSISSINPHATGPTLGEQFADALDAARLAEIESTIRGHMAALDKLHSERVKFGM